MKTWIKTNFYKIISILSLFLATLSTIGIIMILINNKNKCYLDHDYHEVWGNTTIWEHGYIRGDTFFATLYFSKNKANSNDIKWDGTYPDGYFIN